MPALSSHQNDELNNSPNSPGLSRCQCTSSTCRRNPPTTCIYPRHICSLQVSRQVPHFTIPPRSSSHPVSILFSLCLNPFSPPPLHHASVLSPLRLRSFTTPRYFLPSASAGEPLSSQVNRRNPCNNLCISVLLQISRYTCVRPVAANVPQRCFSGRSVCGTPPQVNLAILPILQIISALSQITRYTCERPVAANVPQQLPELLFVVLLIQNS